MRAPLSSVDVEGVFGDSSFMIMPDKKGHNMILEKCNGEGRYQGWESAEEI